MQCVTSGEDELMPGFPAGASARGGATAAITHAAAAREFYRPLLPLVVELARQGLSRRAIARELTRRGVKMRSGWTSWHPTQVSRMLRRADAEGFVTQSTSF
jgi:hypothetical protein